MATKFGPPNHFHVLTPLLEGGSERVVLDEDDFWLLDYAQREGKSSIIS